MLKHSPVSLIALAGLFCSCTSPKPEAPQPDAKTSAPLAQALSTVFKELHLPKTGNGQVVLNSEYLPLNAADKSPSPAPNSKASRLRK